MAIKIAVINQKGGVGKTTTALNLSVCLATGGHRVLAVDLDPQAHLTMGLQIDSDELPVERTVAALFQRSAQLQPLIIPTSEKNLEAVPACIRLAKAAESFYAVLYREGRLREAFCEIAGNYDYVMIDCPPNLGVLTVNAIAAADVVLIPTQPSMYALDGLSDLLDTLETVRRGANHCDWRVLLTMVSGHAQERNETTQRLLAPLASRLLKTQIHRTEAIERSQMRDDRRLGAVVLDEKRWNRGAREYRQLTEEVVALWSAS